MLRPYQDEVVGQFWRTVARGTRRIMLVAPTGAGKTIIAGNIIDNRMWASGFPRVLFIAHRREILTQTSGKLHDLGVAHGVILAGVRPDDEQLVQIASVQTLSTRLRLGKIEPPPAQLVIVDEAHRALGETYREIIARYPDAVLLGLTATPCRGDGRGLGDVFQTLIECPQVAKLIEQGFLVGTRVYAPVVPDLKGVKTVAGDYVEGQLAERMDNAKLVGDLVEHWLKFGEGRQTVCFATGVEHSLHIRDEFIRAGVSCEHIDGATPKAERDATLARLASGEIAIVTNCMVLTEGWDLPPASCCILARPTKKLGLYRQMAGRVLRPAVGKTDAVILDHSGAVFRHGFVEDEVTWTLGPDRRARNKKQDARAANPASRLVECPSCKAVRSAGTACSYCGYLPQRPPRAAAVIDGDLALVDRNRKVKAVTYDDKERRRWHAMLIYLAAERDYKSGWAAHKFKEKFGAWPQWGASPDPLPPTPEVRSWVRSRQIAFAKRRTA